MSGGEIFAFTLRVVPGEVGANATTQDVEQALTLLASVLQAPVSKFGRLLTALKEKQESQAA